MIDLGLSRADEALFEAQLVISHEIRVTLTVLDRNEDVLKTIANAPILTGSITVDTTQNVSRSAQMTVLDPLHALHFDSGNPADGALYADNFLAISYGVYVEALQRWVDVPVFHGPLTLFERRGSEVDLEAQGKESLGLDPHLVCAGYTIPRGTTIRNAIKDVMSRLGEKKMTLGMIGGRLHSHRAIVPGEAPWLVIVGGATDAAGHKQPALMSKTNTHQRLFYDGRGFLTAKRRSTKSIFSFTDAHLVTAPDYTYDLSDFRNRVQVTGGTPKKSKRHYHGSASLPAYHPLSAHSLARNGKLRELVTFYSSSSLKSDAACRAKAEALLDAAQEQGLTATFDVVPVPHLEEGDRVTLNWGGFGFSFPVRQFTLPLTSDQPMSVGQNRRIHHLHRVKKNRSHTPLPIFHP